VGEYATAQVLILVTGVRWLGGDGGLGLTDFEIQLLRRVLLISSSPIGEPTTYIAKQAKVGI